MGKLFEKSFPIIVDLIWVILFITILSTSLFITGSFYEYLSMYINQWISFGISIFLFINTYIIVCGILFRIFVPKMKTGHARVGINKQFFTWRMNWHFYSVVFLFLHKYVFYNRTIRFAFLRLLRVNIKYSSYFAETVDLQDANNLLTIGENSGLGSEVILSTHLALSPTVIIFREVIIGENSHIQGRCCIAPGVTVGNNSIIGFDTALSLSVMVGNNTRIGGKCVINTSVSIGDNCRIGENVYIAEKISIPDNTVISSNVSIMSKADLNKFIINKSENISSMVLKDA